MPGVRYGPDISDDAAYLMERIAVLKQQASRARGAKSTADIQKKLDEAAVIARDLFGVSKRDFKAGRYGDLAELAKYGGTGRYSRVARSKRNGRVYRKSVAKEMADRGSGRIPLRDGTSTKPIDEPYFEGRRATKRFKALEGAARQRAVKKGLTFGKTGKKVPSELKRGQVTPGNFRARLDDVGIARQVKERSIPIQRARGPKALGVNTGQAGKTIRPILPKSQRRRGQGGRNPRG